MKIVKRYYSEQKELIKQLKSKISQEEESSADSSFIASIMEKATALENRKQIIADPEKECIFQALVVIADAIAEMLFLDLIIESDNVKGTITFEAEDILIPGPVKDKVMEHLASLFSQAKDIFIGKSEERELIQVKFAYSLCSEHYVWLEKM